MYMLDREPTEQPLRLLIETSRYREALDLYLSGVDSTENQTPETQALAAQAASRIGEFRLSSALATTAIAGFQQRHDLSGILDCTNLLGALAFERGSLEEAEAHFRTVLELAEAERLPRYTARSANNLGAIAHLRGNTESARYLYEKALRAYAEVDDRRGMAETWHNLALSVREAPLEGNALASCTRAVAAAEQVEAGGLVALTLLGRAEVLIEQGAFADAVRDLTRAETLAWLEGNEPHILETERLRALLALKQSAPREAHQRAELIRSRAEEAGCALIAAESAAIAALALRQDGRDLEAEAAHDLAVASFRAIGALGLLRRQEHAWGEAPA